MNRASVAWVVAGVLALPGCAGTRPKSEPPRGTAEIVVFAYTGLTRPERPIERPTVHLVADMTSLAGAEGSVEASSNEQLALARRLSVDLLPAETPVDSLVLVPFDRLDAAPPSRCAPPRGSWATAALTRLRARLEREATDPTPHVVLVADIARECEVDLCEAGRGLIDTGAWLDVVSLGAVSAPACLRDLRPAADRPGPRVRALTSGPPRFRVERPGTAPPALLATGVADGDPVRVPAGMVRVVVELDDMEVVGPFSVAPGERARIRIQSFPLSTGNGPAWAVDTQVAN